MTEPGRCELLRPANDSADHNGRGERRHGGGIDRVAAT